ncbi:MAG: hypothetical protein ACOYK9_02100 [Chlamydiia bacterium]
MGPILTNEVKRMIEVLKTQVVGSKSWKESYGFIGAGVLLVAAFLGLFASLSSKKGETSVDALSTLIDLEENRTVPLEKRQATVSFLEGKGDLLRQSVGYFIDEPSIVEQATKRAVVPFTQVTRLIAQKRYKEALESAEKNHEELTTPTLRCVNLLRILALEDELKIQDHSKTLEALELLKGESPDAVAEVLAFYQVGNVRVDDLFLN